MLSMIMFEAMMRQKGSLVDRLFAISVTLLVASIEVVGSALFLVWLL